MITIKEYALLNKVSVQTVYSRIKRNVLQTEEIKGVKYIKEIVEKPLNKIKNDKTKSLKKEIKYLKKMLKEKDEINKILKQTLGSYENVLNTSLKNINYQLENKPLNKVNNQDDIIEVKTKKKKKKK